MDELAILRTFAAVTTVLAASLVAANLNARATVAGFMIFIVASIAWMADGWLETKASLVIQNVILLLINAIGVWRWFPKAEKEAKS
jgi:multisubunit Na+/H+ antiporter MnhG subunit